MAPKIDDYNCTISYLVLGGNASLVPTELCDEVCGDEKNARVLMVFPVRGRWELLKSLLRKLLPLLQRKDVCNFIAIVEQVSK